MAHKLSPEQFEAVTRARYGLAPRPSRSVVPAITRRDYAYVLARWAAFDRWKSWRDVGGPRPVGVWRTVPPWDSFSFTPWVLLEQIRKVHPLVGTKPVDPPAPAALRPLPLARGQSWFIVADGYRESFVGPDYFGRAYVADHAYEHPTREEIAALRSRGIRTAVWGDSRIEGDGTPPAQIIDLANELRVDYPIFQAEVARECRAAFAAMDWLGGLGHLLIVNRTQIRDEDDGLYRELGRRLNDGRVIGLCESYRNCGWQPVDYGGLPFASTLGATYQDAGCAGCTLEHLYELGFAAHRDSFYTASWDADYYRAAR